MKKIISIVVLWIIAYITTIIMIKNTHSIIIISPVFLICMIGSIIIINRK